ncbi:hypothetical protein GAYE_SCF07G2880 [Galdieria yellowstonensis]|uniref:Histone deacetylase n=1 Tax=Galdieria yellowstonensis TaxID=3028027 RepID=A0AAV9ICW0_9RHOD|nr:hypothetical protein GAYE_SCF07G2880 [Galdieria yellowstonensis]
MSSNKRRVSYYYDPDVGNYYYSQGHPMKPHRMRMTHALIAAYGMFNHMAVQRPPRASEKDITRFHSDSYINFLKTANPEKVWDMNTSIRKFNVCEDCPVFDGLWEFCQISAGGSLAAASELNSGRADIAINWSGGLHHAKMSEASGFCYVNDCVLGILELLKCHTRVLYADIDIHHGDGVEEAFYTTDRVMTCSFHKFGDYFPGTGDIGDIGYGPGKYYSLNIPLHDGMDDESHREIFDAVMTKVMEWYQPGAVVLQGGADSLSGDRLGCFNLTIAGHSHCIDFFKKYNVPVLMLGGGGYTIRNVARCWAYETSRALDLEIQENIPYNEYLEYYGPEYRIHIHPSNMENRNTREYLENIKAKTFESLRHLPAVPSVPFHETPSSYAGLERMHERELNEEETKYADVRETVRQKERRTEHPCEFEDSDEEDSGALPSVRKNRRLLQSRTEEVRQQHSPWNMQAESVAE